MTGQTLRVNLAAAQFPLLSSENGRSVIFASQGESDVDYTTGVSNKFQGSIPQPIYLSNILPTTKGLTSVKLPVDAEPLALDINLPPETNLYIIRDEEDRRVYYLANPRYNYIYDPTDGIWVSHPIPDADGTEVVTIAYLKERTYIYVENIGCYEYNILNKTFTEVILQALTPTVINGISTGGGLLIAYDDNTIYWSSNTDPTDFFPSLITGAGSTKILSLKSIITLCSAVADGFIIYTAHNAVLAASTGDLTIPFLYREVDNFTGISGIASTSYGSSADTQYCWTSAGLIKVIGSSAGIIYPEVTEFLASRIIEEFNYETNTLDIKIFDKPVITKVRTIGNRFFTVSYGDPNGAFFSNILIYDLPLQRWGKLEADHIDVFDYAVTTPYTAERFNQYPIPANDPTMAGRTADSFSSIELRYTDPAKEIGIVTPNGLILTAVPDSVGTIGHFDTNGEPLTLYNTSKDGVPIQKSLVVLGDYALTRTQFSQMQTVEADTLGLDSSLQILTYLKQEDSIPVNTYPMVDEFDNRKHWSQASGKFHRLMFRGEFFLSTVLICIDGEGEI